MLHYSPARASLIINSCVVLHNMCIENNINMAEEDQVNDNDDLGVIHFQGGIQGRDFGNRDFGGNALRQHIIQTYF